MTEKELLYLQDAIGHEDSIIKIINNTLNKVENEEIISFFQNEIQKHTNVKQDLINVLEEKANE